VEEFVRTVTTIQWAPTAIPASHSFTECLVWIFEIHQFVNPVTVIQWVRSMVESVKAMMILSMAWWQGVASASALWRVSVVTAVGVAIGT
jgi:hypothetical protein